MRCSSLVECTRTLERVYKLITPTVPRRALQCLLFYWLMKLHKLPHCYRLTSYRCTTKPLSKMKINHFRQYCNGIYCRAGVNCFWEVENSQQVLSAFYKNKINYFSAPKHGDGLRFSTLHTSIPQDSQKNMLKIEITPSL